MPHRLLGAHLGEIREGDVVIAHGAGPVGLFAARSSRMGQHRNDTKHLPIDVVMKAAPYLVAGGLALLIGRKLARR